MYLTDIAIPPFPDHRIRLSQNHFRSNILFRKFYQNLDGLHRLAVVFYIFSKFLVEWTKVNIDIHALSLSLLLRKSQLPPRGSLAIYATFILSFSVCFLAIEKSKTSSVLLFSRLFQNFIKQRKVWKVSSDRYIRRPYKHAYCRMRSRR